MSDRDTVSPRLGHRFRTRNGHTARCVGVDYTGFEFRMKVVERPSNSTYDLGEEFEVNTDGTYRVGGVSDSMDLVKCLDEDAVMNARLLVEVPLAEISSLLETCKVKVLEVNP